MRQVVLCKDGDGKIGLRVKAVNKGFHHRFLQFLGILMGNKEKQQEVHSITSHIASSLLPTVVLY